MIFAQKYMLHLIVKSSGKEVIFRVLKTRGKKM